MKIYRRFRLKEGELTLWGMTLFGYGLALIVTWSFELCYASVSIEWAKDA